VACVDHSFVRPELYEQALTHRSAGHHNNERLEFIGDGILNFVIAAALYDRYPDAPEGDLSRFRSRLVRQETLAEIGRELELGPHLIMGSGELKSGGRRRESVLGDTVEAILGAIYLDSGFEACRQQINHWFDHRLSSLPSVEELKDPKTRLQEYLQSRGLKLPVYELIGERGADHDKMFTIKCTIEDLQLETTATAKSRRKAEQSAAAAAIAKIE
jgi:ribonuclease-3